MKCENLARENLHQGLEFAPEIMSDKQKQIKSYVYADIYARLSETEDFKNHGLSYAVNVMLARQMSLPLPETPQSLKSRGARKLVEREGHDVIEMLDGWFDLLDHLLKGETWYRRDQPKFADLMEKSGLVVFAKKHGAKATSKLEQILKAEDPAGQLKELFAQTAERENYKLKYS